MANVPDCLFIPFNELAATTIDRLNTFQVLVGKANFPRVLVANVHNISSIQSKSTTQDNVELEKALQGCSRQLEILRTILDRCIPGGKDAGKKGVAKALKDMYTEKELPKIQKTLHGYEMSLRSSVATMTRPLQECEWQTCLGPVVVRIVKMFHNSTTLFDWQ